MNYTDNQLKAALAKMLPDKIVMMPHGQLHWWPKRNGGINGSVALDTELLHLCWVVEQTCDETFTDALLDVVASQAGYAACLFSHSATWQQRVIALCKVKGIKI